MRFHLTDGTIGKGSTCALLESILRSCNLRTGLYTSPHLVDVRERVRVNGRVLPLQIFEAHVLETYKLLGAERMETIGFFQFLTLMMLKIFARTTANGEKIDVLILETGIGGRIDFTNAFDSPLCCAITKLDYDHMDLLGNTIALIAGEKAGIIKTGVKTFTPLTQTEEGIPVILKTCLQRESPLEFLPPLTGYNGKLGIEGAAQAENASLARAMAYHVLRELRPDQIIREDLINLGLSRCKFPGRSQMETNSDGLLFYLDGAHTPLSVEIATKWFREKVSPDKSKAFVFHCSPDRNGESMLRIIHAILPEMTKGFFVKPSSGFYGGGADYHDQLAKRWKEISPSNEAYVHKGTPEEFRQVLSEEKSNGIDHVFVIGSFYLVGDALKFWVDGWSVDSAFVD